MPTALILAAMFGANAAPAADFSVRANPQRICSATAGRGYLNFDLIVENRTKKDARISEMRAMLFDASGQLIERRLVWQQALALLNDGATLGADGPTILFNPFSFDRASQARRVRYEIDVSGQAKPLVAEFRPASCAPKRDFMLPVTGRLMVYDGHDFWSHHRRGQYLGGFSKALGLTDNFQRFGIDLVRIDRTGALYRGSGARTSDWYGWGQPVRAAAAGTVAAVHDGQPDNVAIGTLDRYTKQAGPDDPMASYGNYVLIDHGAGEFTIVGHLQNGSVAVRKGQRVAAGQRIGSMGNSGASGGVHTHFERRTGPGLAGIETLPPYFSGVRRIGAAVQPAAPVVLDTGDVVESRR